MWTKQDILTGTGGVGPAELPETTTVFYTSHLIDTICFLDLLFQ